VQRHDAAGAVAAVAATLEVHREGEVKRVAHGREDDVADEQRCAGHDAEVATIARHHVEQDQSQPPHWQSRPVVHTITTGALRLFTSRLVLMRNKAPLRIRTIRDKEC